MNQPNDNELTDVVKKALTSYLSQLGDEPAGDIYGMVIRHVERAILETILAYAGGNQSRAALMLGISRNTLRRKLEQYHIQ